MARSSSETSDVPKRAPRRRVAKVTTKAPVVTETISEAPPSRRKAPTQLRTETSERSQSVRRSRVRTYVPIGVLVLGFGAAALIGYSDAGQINISEVVSDRNAQIVKTANENGTPSEQIIIPVQNNVSTAPDGGLISSGAVPPPPPPAPEVASTTEEAAISTDSTATASEEVGEGTPDSGSEVAVPTEEVTPAE